MAASKSGTRITWAVRGGSGQRALGGEDDDELPARGALGTGVRALVDTGTVTLVGATTENPYDEHNAPQMSRWRLVRHGRAGGAAGDAADDTDDATGDPDGYSSSPLTLFGSAADSPGDTDEPGGPDGPEGFYRGLGFGTDGETSGGQTVGVLCVADTRRRRWHPRRLEALAELAELAVAEIERRRARSELAAATTDAPNAATAPAVADTPAGANGKPAATVNDCSTEIAGNDAMHFMAGPHDVRVIRIEEN